MPDSNQDAISAALSSFFKWAHKKAIGELTTPEGGIGAVVELGSGYSVERTRADNVDRLKKLCDEAISNLAWQPTLTNTFCNRGVQYIAQGMGYFKFHGLANDMVAHMAANSAWREERDLIRCADATQKGALVIYGRSSDPHGHVCVGYPAPMQHSGNWGCAVPCIANVGRENGILKLSQVFRADQRPRAWILENTEA